MPDVAIERSAHQLRVQEVIGSDVSSLTVYTDFGDLSVYWRLMLKLIFRKTYPRLWIAFVKIGPNSEPL